jgi:hypothetical protein
VQHWTSRVEEADTRVGRWLHDPSGVVLQETAKQVSVGDLEVRA